MTCTPEYSAIAIEVSHIDDHRQPGFSVTAGIDRCWLNQTQPQSQRRPVLELQGLAGRSYR